MSLTGGDPDELLTVASGGTGQAFLLDHRARLLDAAGHHNAVHNSRSRTHTTEAVATLRQLARRVMTADAWVRRVATWLARADADPLRGQLLEFGPMHPLTAHVPANGPIDLDALPLEHLDGELDAIASWPHAPVAWRDRLHRERARRWVAALPDRLGAVPRDELDGVGGWLARWFDRLLVDRVSLVTDLHVTHAERRELLMAQAVGLEQLLARDDLTLLSFDPVSPTPAGGPVARFALGDVTAARHVAIVLPGTSVGLHAPASALRDAMALHRAVDRGTQDPVATVLDLYDAPLDLGRAADRRTGEAAGEATAVFLRDLTAGLAAPPRTTLVGHSYGAFTAARAAAHGPTHTDAVVLLGAPGTGASHVDELGLPATAEVWAARAPGDPVAAVADLDELVAVLPDALRRRLEPLLAPDGVLGPDPLDPEFGARRLPTVPAAGAPGTAINGHLSYLASGSASVAAVAAVVLGRDPTVRPARPPRRARRASAADD